MKLPRFPPDPREWTPLKPPYPPIPTWILERTENPHEEKSFSTSGQTSINYIIDTELKRELEEKKEQWRKKGYPPGLISMAEAYAIEWSRKMLKSPLFTPIRATPAEEAVARHLFKMGLEISDRWIEKMGV